MIQLTFCLRRLPSLMREEFQRYWREQHAPLVKAAAPLEDEVRFIDFTRSRMFASREHMVIE